MKDILVLTGRTWSRASLYIFIELRTPPLPTTPHPLPLKHLHVSKMIMCAASFNQVLEGTVFFAIRIHDSAYCTYVEGCCTQK